MVVLKMGFDNERGSLQPPWVWVRERELPWVWVRERERERENGLGLRGEGFDPLTFMVRGSLIKFLVRPTINTRRGSTITLYSRST